MKMKVLVIDFEKDYIEDIEIMLLGLEIVRILWSEEYAVVIYKGF